MVEIDRAQQIALDAELDLVEIVPNASPPVCRVMDYGKFKFEKSKKPKLHVKNKNLYM